MNSRVLIFLVCVLCCRNSSAQDSERITKAIFAEASLLYDFPQSYGLTAGINLPLRAVNTNIHSANGKTSTKSKDIIYGVNGGFYRYEFNYTGVFMTPFIGFRHYVHPFLFHETTFGIGLLRTFYDGVDYKVDAAGNVSEQDLYGRFYATTSFSWAINFLLRRPNRSIMAIQLKPVFWLQYPYNSFIKPHFSVVAGIKYQIAKKSVLLKTKTKHKK
jgi:hypothetical protein